MVAPAASNPAPFPIARVLRGIGDWAERAIGLPAGTAIWNDTRLARPGSPYLGLRIVSGPTPSGLPERLPKVSAISSATLTLTAAEGEVTGVRVGYVEARRRRGAGETLAEHRDAVLALLARADHQDDWTAAASGGASILVTPDRVGSLVACRAWTGATAALTLVDRRRLRQSYALRVRATAYNVRAAGDSVSSWIGRLLHDGAGDEDLGAVLRGYGVVLTSRTYAPSETGQPQGPEWESRGAVDLFVEVDGFSHAACKGALAGAVMDSASALVDGAGDSVGTLGLEVEIPGDLPPA